MSVHVAAGNPLSWTFALVAVATPGCFSSTSTTARTPPTNPLHYCPAPNQPRCRHSAHIVTNASDTLPTFCIIAHTVTNASDALPTFCIITSVLLPGTAICLCSQLGCGSFTCNVL